VKCQNETIIKDLTISVINEKSFSNYDNYHPNDSTGHFVFVLQSGHNYNIEFKIDDLITYDTIRVPENEKGIQEYTKIVKISEKEITISDGVEVGNDIIDNQDLSNLNNNNQSTLQGFEPQKTSKLETGFKTSVSFDVKLPVEENKEANDTSEKHILFHDNIYFKSESSDLTNHEKVKLNKLIIELKNNPSWTINSIGHTDNKGSIRYNQILSTLRSESVKTYICNRGINYKRVHTVGKGETLPIAENVAADGSDNPTGSAANRRVEIQIIK
jgi:outer membrane protein OmpA-like peptidoglycan-associated protein